MKKINRQWSVKDLQGNFELIEFPEYQREPTVWGVDKKRKLIDSMLRNFDIASIYLYKRADGNYDCIDGRQRINAILSYLGLNDFESSDDDVFRYDNAFKFFSSDELLRSEHGLSNFHGKKYDELTESQQKRLLSYTFNVIEITDIEESDELNLMFLRLQLGAALNAGEKLNAMVGQMRDFIFEAGGLGRHKYFRFLNIPNRRFSRELTAAQIALNFFSLAENRKYRRARFVDLQEFFSANLSFDPEKTDLANTLRTRLSKAHEVLKDSGLHLKNRAIGVSTFFFINALLEENREDRIRDFISFLKVFLVRLKEQVERGIHIKREYEEFLRFQTYISQAAVEKYAIESRHAFLQEYFTYYLETGKIKGDR